MIYLFSISVIAALLMLVGKQHELSTGKVTVFASFLKKTDPILKQYWNSFIHFLSLFNKRTARLLLHMIVEEMIHFLKAIKRRLDSKQSKFFMMVKGKGEVKRRGSASFFLKHIKEHKDALRKE